MSGIAPRAARSDVELQQVLADLRATIRRYAITPEQLFDLDLSALIRFRDPGTGQTWNGAGRPPDWIRGKDRERFRVK